MVATGNREKKEEKEGWGVFHYFSLPFKNDPWNRSKAYDCFALLLPDRITEDARLLKEEGLENGPVGSNRLIGSSPTRILFKTANGPHSGDGAGRLSLAPSALKTLGGNQEKDDCKESDGANGGEGKGFAMLRLSELG